MREEILDRCLTCPNKVFRACNKIMKDKVSRRDRTPLPPPPEYVDEEFRIYE